MRDEQVPDDRLERFGVRSHVFGIHRRNDHAGVRHLGGVATISTDHADDPSADSSDVLERLDDVRADVFLKASTAYRENADDVLWLGAAALPPAGKNGLPSFVIGPGRQFRDIVDWRGRFDARDLAEIIDRMRAVRRAPANPEKEQPSAVRADAGNDRGHALYSIHVNRRQDSTGLFEVLLRVCHPDTVCRPEKYARVSASPSGEPIS